MGVGKLGMLVDVERCIGCNACTIACKAENKLPEGIFATTIQTNWEGKFPGVVNLYNKVACMHCENPLCVEVCPTGALYKTPEGIVAHDLDKCVGCQYCVTSCPFHIPQYSRPDDKSFKCTMCIHRVSQGMEPACVATCPTKALQFGKRDKMMAIAQQRLAELKEKYPNANIYSPEEVGGTGLIYVLTDDPAKFGLIKHPQVSGTITAWQDYIQPYAAWLIPLALLGSATSFVTTRLLANKHQADEERGDK